MKVRRCYGCMQEFADEFELCPHCGFIVGTAQEIKSHLPCGTKLSGGRYILGKVLGYGGFGITYIAWDSKRNRPVAIKEFFPNAFSTRSEGETVVSCYNSKSEKFFKEGVRKMLDEAERLSKFHKNESIVNVYDYFEANKTAYIVMEYLEGKDLKKYLEENRGKLDADEAIEIMLPVLNALNDMHKENLIHRDVSPDNIFICNNGKVKILDFGSARLAVTDADKSMSVMLKKGYAPKEQYSSHSKQGPWTDVYAASATLYELVTGHKPVDSMDRDEEPLKTFKELGVLGMGELEAVILKGMAQDVSERTPDAATLYTQLAELIRPTEGVKPDFTPKSKAPQKTKKSKKPLVIAAVIAVLVIAGATGGKFAWDRFAANTEESITTTVPATETTTEEITAEVTPDAPMLSDNVVYEFKNGEQTVTEKLNTILGEKENIFMADINGDKNSEIIIIKESETPDESGEKPSEVLAYTTIADGTTVETKINCGTALAFYADTENNVLIIEDKTSDEDGYRHTATKISVDPVMGFVLGDKITVSEKDFEGNFTGAQKEKMVVEEYGKKYAEFTNGLTALTNLAELNFKGTCGENSKWIYHKGSNLLRVLGTDYIDGNIHPNSDVMSWDSVAGEVKTVILSKDIIGIGRKAFSDFTQMEEILIGDKLSDIGDKVFENCKNLKRIKLNGLRNIGEYVFYASGVEEIIIGKHLTKITDSSFYAPNLKGISVEDNDTYSTDGTGVLYRNKNELILYPAGRPDSEYTVKDGIITIGSYAFRNAKNLKKINFNEITSMKENAFMGCTSLTEIRISENIKTIPSYCFAECTSLTYIEISKSVTKIEDYAFCDCISVPSVIIPSSVTVIGEGAFEDCDSLKKIAVDKKQSECSAWKNWSGDAQVKYKEETTTGRFQLPFGIG